MKKYNVIYADPPWQTKAGRPLGNYVMKDGKQMFSGNSQKSRELAYKSMGVDEIAALPVKNIAAKDAHLYMWVTNQYLLRASEVIEAWGFRYSTALVWAKNPMGGGLGGAFGISTEFLLFCTKGSLKSMKRMNTTWYNVKRQYKNGYPAHSIKPDFFQELIEQVSPGHKLELFARRNREGWDAFGNEVKNSIQF